ncbi:MAG: bacillithiol system redox-active protein YtxJ [Bacteroidetes bacterium]|nr:bacillithiol system redox-active protein YtxJ [Bacteroidota bacterium]
MNWNDLNEMAQLEHLKELSRTEPVVIFKHSTRCSISSMAKQRLERAEPAAGVNFYYLDLLKHRDISNKIAEEFSVVHQSPQVLLLRNGACVYEETHSGINMDEIAAQLS